LQATRFNQHALTTCEAFGQLLPRMSAEVDADLQSFNNDCKNIEGIRYKGSS